MEIVVIQDSYRDGLGDQVLDFQSYESGKFRYYCYKVPLIDGYSLIIPLRKNCSHSQHFTPIKYLNYTSHGLDYEKMLLIDGSEFLIRKAIDKGIYKEICSKATQITTLSVSFMNEYKSIIEKKESGQFLSKDEMRILKITTLQYFNDVIMENTL